MTEASLKPDPTMDAELEAKIRKYAEETGRDPQEIADENKNEADEAKAVGDVIVAIAKELTPSPPVALTALSYAVMRVLCIAAKTKEGGREMLSKLTRMNEACFDDLWERTRGEANGDDAPAG